MLKQLPRESLKVRSLSFAPLALVGILLLCASSQFHSRLPQVVPNNGAKSNQRKTTTIITRNQVRLPPQAGLKAQRVATSVQDVEGEQVVAEARHAAEAQVVLGEVVSPDGVVIASRMVAPTHRNPRALAPGA